MTQFIKNRVLRVVIRLIVSLLALVFLLVASLQIPYIQTKAVNWTSTYLTEQIGYPINIERVDISWADEAVLEGVNLHDKQGQEFIHIEKALIDFQLRSFFKQRKIVIEDINLVTPKVYLDWDKEKGVLNVNTFIRAIKKAFKKPGKNKKKPKYRAFTILNLTISNGSFSYQDNRKGVISHNGFDHNHFELDSIYASATDFYIHYDTIQLFTKKLKAREKNIDYRVHNLSTLFRYTKKSLEFYDIDGFVENSHLTKNIIMRYDTIVDLADFNNKVVIDANLDGSTIFTRDLAAFAPAVKSFKDKWYIEGQFKGKVNDFKADNFLMTFGKNSKIHGSLSLKGLPQIAETYINIDLVNSKIDSKDLRNYLNNNKHYQTARKFGVISFNSDFVGFPQDFVAHGNFNTDMGNLISDLKFEIREEEAFSYYKGHLKTNDFNLRKFLNVQKLGLINMDGQVEGSGFTIDDAKLKLQGNINRIDFNNYSYQNIKTNADLEEGYISGEIDINDPSLHVNTENINIDFRDKKDSINITAFVSQCLPQNLNFTQDSSYFKGEIDIQTSGLDLDNLIGSVQIVDAKIYNNKKDLDISKFVLSSSIIDTIRDIKIESDFADFKAIGDFKFKTIVSDLRSLIEETNLIFLNNTDETKKYYSNKTTEDNNYKINYELKTHNLNPLLELVDTNLFLSPKSIIKGDFKHGKNTVLNVFTKIDSIKYNNHAFKKNILDLSFSKITDSTDVLASGTFNSSKYYNKEKLTTSNIKFQSLWLNDSLTFQLGAKNPYNRDEADLKGNISFMKKEIIVSLFDSRLYLMNKNWKIQKGNMVRIGKDILFKNLSLKNKKERISIEGLLSKDPNKLLLLNVENFQLSTLDPISPIKFKGLFNGNIKLKDALVKPTFFSDAKIINLHLKDYHLGNLSGSFNWSKATNILNSDIDLEQENLKVAHAVGSLNLNSQELNYRGNFENTPLAFLEELLYGHATHITGRGNGKVDLTGTLDNPNFNGSINIANGGFTIEYLKTHYTFNDNIFFKDNKIIVNNITLTDTLYNTTGNLSGYLKHTLFKNFETDILLKLNNTLALNTKSENNKLYYGTAFGTGEISIQGPFNNLKIDSRELTSEKGTKLYIPLEETESISQKEYITFKRVETKKNKTKQKLASNSKMDIRINFDIKDDTYFEIIFDKKAGDIIKGYGEGQIELKLNTKGDFNMYGTYNIKKGSYNFTLVNLINKRFYIDQGSEIRWNGDPYDGKLDIKAKYQLSTSLLPLIADTAFASNNPDIRRRQPVDVEMYLNGPLLSPEIKFDIDIIDYPNYIEVEQAVNEFNTQIKFNEQLLNNQVFSLMVLKQFAPLEQQNTLNIGSAGGNNLSELFSNQFSSWVSQFDENLDIDIDLEGFDDNSSSSFRLKLSYSILDGKIRVSRDGSFTNLDDQDQLANLFGEWTIEYLISKNGNLRLKAYNKTNQNNVSTAIQNTSSQLYGASISHTATFDNLSELFRKNPNKKEAQDDEEFLQKELLKNEDEIEINKEENEN